MQLDAVINTISESSDEILGAIRGDLAVERLGLRRSARLPVVCSLYNELGWPILLVTDRADHALTLTEELKLWAPDASHFLFPEPTPLFYERAAWGEGTRRDRMLVFTTLAAYHIPGVPRPERPPMIVAPARALMTRTLPRAEFLGATRTLRTGQDVNVEQLLREWVTMGYEPVNTVIAPGEFARRGGILDLWPPAEALPVRIELFGDEIDTLRYFDPATQRTTRPTADDGSRDNVSMRVLITPARELLTPSDQEIAPHTASRRDASQEEFFEFHIPEFHKSPACLLDYLPRQSLVLLDNKLAIEGTAAEVEEGAVKMRDDFIKEGTLPPDFPIPYMSWSEIQDSVSRRYTLELGPVSAAIEEYPSVAEGEGTEAQLAQQGAARFAERFAPEERFGGRLKMVMSYLLDCYRAGEALVIVSRQAARLKALWEEEFNPTVTRVVSDGTAPAFIEGSLTEGWVFTPPDRKPLHLLTDGEVFGWRRPQPRYRRSDRYQAVVDDPESAYSDLQVGDYVVHVDYGVGRFSGLVQRTVDQLEREFLRLEYAGGAELYVPVHQVDRLTRYVGPDNREPRLSRLGGTEWRNVKSHVREAVVAVAQELLDLYAQRSMIKGFAFSPDTVWQGELEASFPYIETDDQKRVLAEVKQDMENQLPMDRLICGDVGYGKTEVALRAAFKAVNDSRQVALLVPTTVLAQQHYHTFVERLAAFPVEVEMLSRFRTPQQQRAIIKRLGAGQVDILIGTHRLFSSDVKFKDLGLLIIDEEQRFGVTHKETLKKMRTEVDVLTLTATPIPRTLYMALSGVRDISTINTPPEERLPIATHIGPYSKRLVRQAILRELERGGQVFFVHNRVQTIEAMSFHLRRLVPGARITIAHGQMSEKDLSRRMEQFSGGEVDVLLSTSIIESGLDIPSANTLIVDRADMFGLAQLYQLRGRVGRGAQRAYAYFFRHKRKSPTPEGRQRLETIAENTQLGAGFSIAMRDLEIRGTGDILGTRQHGHIAAVGFHLYTRLLAGAVRRLRKDGSVPSSEISVTALAVATEPISMINIELPQAVSIPSDYVADKNTRLGLYRRLAGMQEIVDVDALAEEMQDRFGPLPELVHNLLFQARVKIYAQNAGLASVTLENGQFVLRYPDGEVPERLPYLDPSVRIGKTALWMPFSELPGWAESLVAILKTLNDPVLVK